jgi:hypothetical protein
MTEYSVFFRHSDSMVYLKEVEAESASDAVKELMLDWGSSSIEARVEIVAFPTDSEITFTAEEVREIAKSEQDND